MAARNNLSAWEDIDRSVDFIKWLSDLFLKLKFPGVSHAACAVAESAPIRFIVAKEGYITFHRSRKIKGMPL